MFSHRVVLLRRASLPAFMGLAEGESEASMQVKVDDYPSTRLLTLNRPDALNATNLGMSCLLHRHLIGEPHSKDAHVPLQHAPHSQAQSCSPSSGCVYVLRGAGPRSFCAGGDVVTLMKDEPPGSQLASPYVEFQVDYHMWRSTRPPLTAPHRNTFVAMWNGYVMGGGLGLSIHVDYRVACPATVVAMPETAIGFFPDVGASWFLPRLDLPTTHSNGGAAGVPGLGLFMGLLGRRLKGADLLHAGLATHYVDDVSKLDALQEDLCHVKDRNQVEAVMRSHALSLRADDGVRLPPFSLREHAQLLRHVFSLRPNLTMEAIVGSLETQVKTQSPGAGRAFADSILAQLTPSADAVGGSGSKKQSAPLSPTSMKLALELQHRGSHMADLADALVMEYGVSTKACRSAEFSRGVRALLIDKTNNPKWSPAGLSEVLPEHIDAYFKTDSGSIVWHPTQPYQH